MAIQKQPSTKLKKVRFRACLPDTTVTIRSKSVKLQRILTDYFLCEKQFPREHNARYTNNKRYQLKLDKIFGEYPRGFSFTEKFVKENIPLQVLSQKFMKFPFHYGNQQTNQSSSVRKILPVKSPVMQTQIHSSNINEVIRAVSNVLLFLFYEKILYTQKAPNSTKSTKKHKKHKKYQKTPKNTKA